MNCFGLFSVPVFAFCINRNCLFLAISYLISASSPTVALTTSLPVSKLVIFESSKALKEYMSIRAMQLFHFSTGCVKSSWGFCGVRRLTDIFFLSCICRSMIYWASSRISSPRSLASAIDSCKPCVMGIDLLWLPIEKWSLLLLIWSISVLF